VGTGVGRFAWEAVHSAFSPSSEASSAASTLWRLALVPSDDWEATSMMASSGSLKTSRKMNKIFKLPCNFTFFWGPVCTRVGVMH
jgi:hypothetical protein